nr:TetR family transcriptional regulator [Ktedonobacter racemifer]
MQITERAGLTERTFFRYFVDKREILFWGQAMLQELCANTIANMPDTATPINMVNELVNVLPSEQVWPSNVSTCPPM